MAGIEGSSTASVLKSSAMGVNIVDLLSDDGSVGKATPPLDTMAHCDAPQPEIQAVDDASHDSDDSNESSSDAAEAWEDGSIVEASVTIIEDNEYGSGSKLLCQIVEDASQPEGYMS
jgi:hypothetical protein